MKNQTYNSRRLAKLAVLSLALLMSVFTMQSSVAMTPPDQVAKNAVNALVSNIQENRELYKNDTQALYDMVDNTLISAVHVPRMARLILGKYGKTVSPDRVEAFADEFKQFLLINYASVLLEYTGDEKVNFLPVDLAPGSDRVVVKAELIAGDGTAYAVNLHMSNRRDTSWRAFNLEIGGLEFISTYRDAFKNTLATKGVEGLIADLKAKNAG